MSPSPWKVVLVGGATAAALAIGGMSRGEQSNAAQSNSALAPAGSWPATAPPATPQAPPADAPPAVRGAYLTAVADCAGCHTAPGGKPFAGGLPLNTPFGVIYSSNITPDKDTGIGNWTAAQFRSAMKEGKDDAGKNLYPAMPYPYYSHMPDGEVEAIRAYLMTLPAVHAEIPPNKLPFPLNIRFMVKFWNWLNFKPSEFKAVATESPEWNRGAYIVNGPGHCGACHTPKNILGGDKRDQTLKGGELDFWYAPNLTGDARRGLHDWSIEDIATYLRSGMNGHAEAAGSMQDVIENSTSKMSDQDLRAIAVYLKSLPGAPPPAPSAPGTQAMRSGQAIYVDQCAACHGQDGAGVPGLFPPLKGNPEVQQARATSPLHAILAGAQAAATPTKPSQPAMPAYAWKLTDYEIAAVSTYLRNSWGNAAEPVTDSDVAKVRAHVAAHPAQRKKRVV